MVAGIRRLILRDEASLSRASEVMTDYVELPLIRHGHRGLLGRVFQLRDNFSAYDASYVALAEHLSATLVTVDGRLARAARAHSSVEVVT